MDYATLKEVAHSYPAPRRHIYPPDISRTLWEAGVPARKIPEVCRVLIASVLHTKCKKGVISTRGDHEVEKFMKHYLLEVFGVDQCVKFYILGGLVMTTECDEGR